MSIEADGNLALKGSGMLFVSLFTPNHALYYLNVPKGGVGYIIRFQLDEQFVSSLQGRLVEQKGAAKGSPQYADQHVADIGGALSVGIPSSMLGEFLDAIVPGSAEIWYPAP